MSSQRCVVLLAWRYIYFWHFGCKPKFRCSLLLTYLTWTKALQINGNSIECAEKCVQRNAFFWKITSQALWNKEIKISKRLFILSWLDLEAFAFRNKHQHWEEQVWITVCSQQFSTCLAVILQLIGNKLTHKWKIHIWFDPVHGSHQLSWIPALLK